MATPIGFEPTISTLTGWHVRPLHHGAARHSLKVRAGGQSSNFTRSLFRLYGGRWPPSCDVGAGFAGTLRNDPKPHQDGEDPAAQAEADERLE